MKGLEIGILGIICLGGGGCSLPLGTNKFLCYWSTKRLHKWSSWLKSLGSFIHKCLGKSPL